jgi:hypothetical protein
MWLIVPQSQKTGKKYHKLKINTGSGIKKKVVDEDGNVVDYEKTLAELQNEIKTDRGKKSELLYNELREKNESDTIRITINVERVNYQNIKNDIEFESRLIDQNKELSELMDDFHKKVSQRIQRKIDNVVAGLSKIDSVEIVNRGETDIGKVWVRTRADDVNDIEKISEINELSKTREFSVGGGMKEAGATHESGNVTASRSLSAKYDLTGYDIGVLDYEGHPFDDNLENVIKKTSFGTQEHWHAHFCAMVAASNQSGKPGIAKFANIYSAYHGTDGTGAAFDSKLDWFQNNINSGDNNSARVVTNSAYTGEAPGKKLYTESDELVNTKIFNDGTFQFYTLAGNEDDVETGSNGFRITSPSRLFNCMTVGAMGTNVEGNNLYNLDKSKAQIYSDSCYIPIKTENGDLKKPEIVACGTSVDLPSSSENNKDNNDLDGTSFSTPMVAAAEEILWQSWKEDPYVSGTAFVRPDTMKAILMASADDIGTNYSFNKWGAGQLNIKKALEIRNNDWWDFTIIGEGITKEYPSFYAEEGESVRIVLSWMALEDEADGTTESVRPDVDLDLEIIGPNGFSQATSTNFDSCFELIDFTPSTTGNHKARVQSYRFTSSDDSRIYSVAWYRE